MAGDDDVTIKLAADVDQALRAFVELIASFKDINEVIKVIGQVSADAGVETSAFLTKLRDGVEKSSFATTDLGKNFGTTLTEIEASLKTAATGAEGMATAVTGIGAATTGAAGSIDQFATSVTTGAAAATDALGATKTESTLLSETFSTKLAPSAEDAAAAAGPLFATLEEGGQTAAAAGKAATDGLAPLGPVLEGMATGVNLANAEQTTFFSTLDKGSQTTWKLGEAITDLTQKRDEERATFAAFSEEQKQQTFELTQALLEEEVKFKDIAAAAGLSEAALKLLNQEQAELKQKVDEAAEASKPFWQDWLDGVKQSEVATVAWGVVLADTFKKLGEGLYDAITSLPDMVTHMAAVGDEALTMANRLGLTAEAVAELDYITGQSGTSMQGLARTIQGFGAQVSKTGSASATALASIGLSMKQMAADGLSSSDQVFKVIEQIKLVVPAADQATKAVEILGPKFRANTALMAEDIGELRDRFHELGGDEGVGALGKAGDRWSDLMNDMTLSMDGFKRGIAVSVLGPMNDVAEFVVNNVHPAFLLLGSGVGSVVQAMVPFAAQMFAAKVATLGLTETMAGVLKAIKTQTAAIWLNVASWEALPWVALGTAIVLLLVGLYKLIGGWEGLIKICDAVTEALEPLTTFLKNVFDIVWILGEQAIAGLIEWVTKTIKIFNEWWTSAEKGEGTIGKVWDKIKLFAGIALMLTPIGPVLKLIWQNWETIAEKVVWAYGKVKEFFAFLGKQVQADADAQRKWHEEKSGNAAADQKAWDDLLDRKEKEEQAWYEYVKGQKTGTQQLLENQKKLTAAYQALTTEQKAAIKAGLQDLSAKEVAQQMYVDLGLTLDEATAVVDRYSKAQKDAAKATKSAAREAAKDPYNKMIASAKALAAELTAAAQAGIPLSVMVEEFGKQAADMATKAAMYGALDKIDTKTRELADTWNAGQFKEKMVEANKAALELSRTFGEKMTASTAAAAASVKAMNDEIAETFLHGDAKVQAGITKEHDARIAGITAEQKAAQAAYDDRVRAAEAAAAVDLKAAEATKAAGQTVSAEVLARIEREKQSAIGAAKLQLMASVAGAEEQKKVADDLAEHKRRVAEKSTGDFETDMALWGAVTQKAANEQLAIEKKKLAAMRAANKPFYADQIKAQEEVVAAAEQAADAFEKNAAAQGIVTKKAAERHVSIEKEKLDYLTALNDPYYAAQIAAQKRVLEAAEVAAGKTKQDWGAALASITDSFEQLANISGGTFGGIMKGMGEVFATAKMFAGKEGGPSMFSQMIGGTNEQGVALKGMEKWTATATKGVAMAGAVVDGIGAWKKAMDEKSTGKRLLGGTMAGAKAGAMFGPYGMAVGAAAGFVAGLIKGKPAWAKAADEVSKDFGVKISDELAKTIADRAKKDFGGDRMTAAIASLPAILQEAGGVTDKNAKQMTARLADVFSLMKSGKLTADQARETVDQSFGAFADHILKSGKVASKEFLNIIKLNQESGLASEQVLGFVTAQTERLGVGLSKLVAPYTKNIALLTSSKTAAAALGAELAKTSDPKKVGELQAELDKVNATITDTTGKLGDTNAAMGRFERLTLAGFNSAIKSGVGYLDAIDAIGPALDQMVAANTALGREGGEAINELLRFRAVAAANQDVVESAGALNEVMLALSNTGALNMETMADLQEQGTATFAQLTAAGFSEGQSLQQMKGYLEQVRNAHKELGLPIDENTQKLIDQAEQQGVLKKEQISTNEIMMTGLSAVIEALGGKVPAAFKRMQDAAVASATKVGDTVNQTVNASLDATATKLNETPWSGYAAKGVAAGNVTKDALLKVDSSADGVAASLDQTDWSGWSEDAVNAAREAQAAVDAVSLGSSPGGIKEIPIKLLEAMRAFRQWEKQGVISAGAVERAVESVEHASSAISQVNAATKDEMVHDMRERGPEAGVTIAEGAIFIDRPILKDRESMQELAVEVARNLKKALAPTGAWT